MNRRDDYRNSVYFAEYIRKQNERIDRWEKILVESNEQKKISNTLCYLYKDLIAAQLSAECDSQDIKSSYNLYAGHALKAGFSSYDDYADCLSLAILLNEEVDFPVPPEFDDDLTRVLDSIIRNVPAHPVGNILFKDIYGVFYDYFIDNVNFEELIKYVNTGWYHVTGGMYWHDRHKMEKNTYSGYWCYVASALIKVKNDYALVSENDKYIVCL